MVALPLSVHPKLAVVSIMAVAIKLEGSGHGGGVDDVIVGES